MAFLKGVWQFYRFMFGRGGGDMTQDERWVIRYNEVKTFIEEHHRNPSKYNPDEMLMVHFLKRNRKLMNAGELVEPRLGKFKELLVLSEKYRRKNQYI